jgi:hypothetical protein
LKANPSRRKAMKCSSCGANYDDKFAFCPYCGTARMQSPTVRVAVEEPRYEYCSVVTTRDTSDDLSLLNIFRSDKYEWWVEACGHGAKQDRVYAKSATFRSKIHELSKYERPYQIDVCRQLEEAGWEEAEGKGGRQYRRRIK